MTTRVILIAGMFFIFLLMTGCAHVQPVETVKMPLASPSMTPAATKPATPTQAPVSILVPTRTILSFPPTILPPTATMLPPLDGRGGGVIAFDLYFSNTRDIYLMNADGSGIRRLTFDYADDYDPAWSLDGTQLAFVSDRTGSPNIFVVDLEQALQDPKQAQVWQVTDNEFENKKPAWSPAGDQFVFESNQDGNWEIYIVGSGGGEPTRLTNSPLGDNNPAWSPDGKLIGFSSYRDGNWEIYTMNFDGSDPRRLTQNERSDYEPVWSPDGVKIVYECNIDVGIEVCVMNADGSDSFQLTNNDANTSDPVWSPDGGRILYSVHNRGVDPGLYMMNADGSGQHFVLAGAGSYTHDWGAYGIYAGILSDTEN
jgi:Tol biopolymer transport system component